jgi:hypothetical protein
VLMWTDGLAVPEIQLSPLDSATSKIECMEQFVISQSDRRDDATFL